MTTLDAAAGRNDPDRLVHEEVRCIASTRSGTPTVDWHRSALSPPSAFGFSC